MNTVDTIITHAENIGYVSEKELELHDKWLAYIEPLFTKEFNVKFDYTIASMYPKDKRVFLQEHSSKFQYLNFVYDLNDICINPIEVYSFAKKGAQQWDRVSILVSRYEECWVYGFEDTSKGLECSLRHSCHATEDDAIKTAISELKDNLENNSTFSTNAKEYLKALKEWEYERTNLTLF